jgi:Ca2+-binding EF-hand superfamily protein
MQDIFLKITNFQSIGPATITRAALRQYLSKRYKGAIAAIITDLFSVDIARKPDHFWTEIETLLNFNQERLYDMAFRIYDVGQDKQIDSVDLYALMKMYDKEYDELFIKAYS